MKLLPYAGTRLARYIANCNWPHRSEMTLVQRLPIKGLLRMEPKLIKNQIAHYKDLTPDHDPVIIAFHKGVRFIWDGNHRVQARREKNFKTVRALVFELEC